MAEEETKVLEEVDPEIKAVEEAAKAEEERLAKLTPEEKKSEEETKARENEKKLSLESQEKVQARIDEIIAEKKELKRRVDELEGSLKKETPKEYTKEQLVAVLQDTTHPEYHAWAIVELTRLETQSQFKGFTETQSVAQKKQESIEKARDEYPEIFPEDGSKTEAWKLADKIYTENHLDKVEDGQYIAATLAMKQLNKGKETDTKALQRKIDKETAKKSLAAGGKPIKISDATSYEKLREKALKEGPKSKVFKEWQKESLKKQGIKI